MKKNLIKLSIMFISLITVFITSTVSAETYTGSLTLTSQAEVDAFSYSEVTGSMTISGEDIVNLRPLSVLTSVGEYISISDNTALTVVEDAFPNLTNLGWGIYVYYNPNLVSFSGFKALTATGDNIDFWYNDSLTIVSGFNALQTAGWSLEFGGNPVLTEIPEFESLETISSSLFIMDNASLTSITGFNALQYIDWSFDIVGNPSLSNLCGFYNYFFINNGIYTGGGSNQMPMTIQEILDAGPCSISPLQQIDNLIADIEAMALPKKTTNNLIKPSNSAKRVLEKGSAGKAITQFEALINKIGLLEQRGELDGITADELIDAVLSIIDSINS